jgi:hypothetical protein
MTFGFHFMEIRVALTVRVQRTEIKRALPIVTSIIFCNGKSYYDIYWYCDRNPDSAVQCNARHRESRTLKKQKSPLECTQAWRAKAAFSLETFHQQIGLKFKEETSEMVYYSVALYGDWNWALRKAEFKYFVSSEMWCWRRRERISTKNET